MSTSPLTPAINALETLINRALALDPDSVDQLSKLNGRHIGVTCTVPPLTLSVSIQSGRISLQQGILDEAQTKISGSALEFIRIATARDPAAALINGDVTIAGDTSTLLQLRETLAKLDLDWEAPLAAIFGDVVGHTLGSGLRMAHKTALGLFGQLREQFSHHMREESELVPRPYEARAFFDEVDTLSQRTERLQAKLASLRSSSSRFNNE